MFDGASASGFGDLLRLHRRAAGLSQRELAALAEMSTASVRDLEQGRTKHPKPASTRRLTQALGLSSGAAEVFDQAARPTAAAIGAADGPVQVLVLGPLTVRRGPVDTQLGADMQRTIVGRLALTPDEAVPLAELMELLWEHRPPRSAVNLIQTYVTRLRRLLRPGGMELVHSRSTGYLLRATDDRIDVLCFRQLVRQADAAPAADAIDLFEQALRLWRGDPAADVKVLAEHPRALTLTEERIDAAVRFADLTASVGRHDRSLPVLRELAARHLLHEPLWARLMLALAATGLQAAALDAFDQIRHRLADELGIDPGPELTQYYQRVLHQQWSPAPPGGPGGLPPPAQLPADLSRFAGRTDALALLDQALDAGGPAPAVVITAVSGTAGVGKTTLAVRWAHRVRDRFPDGQLYLNLRGFHPGAAALTPGEALPGLLVALGVRAEQIPPTLDAQAGLYRTLLADRRVLVLLDNARDAEQVRPLLPGAPGCLALLTSRHELTGLVAAEGAHAVALDLLTPDESRQMLTRRLGSARIAAEPKAVDAIIERCARLPLALAIAAARAAARPHAPLAELAAELAELSGNVRRLDAFSTGDTGTDVRTVFSWSYRLLPPTAARLFRLLGLQPGADLSADAAASLAGSSRAEVAPLLAELLAVHLLAEPASGRYAMHDLLRAYAAERATDEEPEPARHAALTRLFDHYLDTARAAIQVLFPAELDHLPAPSGPVPDMAGPAAARSWLDAERANLTVVIGHTAEHGWPGHTAALATTLHHYLDSGYPSDTLIVHTHAHRAARDAGDHTAAATALNHLGIAHRRAGRFHQAGRHHRQALALCRNAGDRAGEARTLIELGIVAWRLGRYDGSKQHHQAALDLFREIGDRLGEANQLNMFGIGYRQTGHLDTAIDCHRQAFNLYHDLGNPLGEANSLNGLGAAYHQAGRLQQAIDCQRRALATVRECGHRPVETLIRNDLGRALLLLGDHHGARVEHEHALALCREAGEHSFEVETVNALGAALLAASDPGTARIHFTDALDMAQRTGDRHQQAAAHDGLADTYRATADPERARQHWQQARVIYLELGLPDADRITHKIKASDRIT